MTPDMKLSPKEVSNTKIHWRLGIMSPAEHAHEAKAYLYVVKETGKKQL
jgi:hypothetical protein